MKHARSKSSKFELDERKHINLQLELILRVKFSINYEFTNATNLLHLAYHRQNAPTITL